MKMALLHVRSNTEATFVMVIKSKSLNSNYYIKMIEYRNRNEKKNIYNRNEQKLNSNIHVQWKLIDREYK